MSECILKCNCNIQSWIFSIITTVFSVTRSFTKSEKSSGFRM